jgi:hypothetical protein
VRTSFDPFLTAPILGILSGLGALEHAVGEMRQGSSTPDGLVFESWVDGPIADHMGGEPAMSLIPHLFLSGLATALVAAMMIGLCLAPSRATRRGWGLVGLSVAMLLVGGGFAPPIIGALAGGSALMLRSPADSPRGLRLLLARAWPSVFALAVGVATLLIVGSVALVYGFGLDMPGLFVSLFFLTVILAALAIPAGSAYQATLRASATGDTPS